MEAVPSPSNWVATDRRPLGPAESQSRFRLMLVHDGYQHLDQVINDLQRRGYPIDAEVLLLSVSDLFRTTLRLVGKDFVQSVPSRASLTPNLPKHRKSQAFFDKLESVKRQAHARLQAAFPGWEIRFERPLGWQPNLIFLGAFDQSSTSNPGLGEIIRKVSSEANIPMIVARPQWRCEATNRPSVVAIDGPASAAAVLKELQQRPANRGSDLYLLFYKDPLMTHAERWSASYEEPDREWIDRQLIKTKTAIEALGYKVRCVTAIGHTAQAIFDEAKRVEADSILLGAGPLAGLGSLRMQSIAADVAAQANCSVEIVFSGHQQPPAASLEAIAAHQNIAA